MSLVHRRGVLLDGIGSELVRSSNGGRRKTLSEWLGDLSNETAQTFTSGDATPSVLNGGYFITAGSTAITNFDDGVEGQVIAIYRGNSDITITDNANIDPIISGNIALNATRPSATFRLASGVWKQVEESGAAATAWIPVQQSATLAAGQALIDQGNPFTDVASAATVDLGAVASDKVRITGSTGPITSFGTVAAGTRKLVRLASTPTITYNATSLILPGDASIVGQADDEFEAVSLGSGNWYVGLYQRGAYPPATVSTAMNAVTSGSIDQAMEALDQGDFTATGASAAADLATRFSDAHLPWVNVKDFGAKGDTTYNASGTFVSGTVDTAAIQAAIDYLEATTHGRGTVFFPRGYYRIDATLRIKKGILLRGCGSGHNHDSTTAVNVAIKDAATALCWHNASGDKVVHMEPAVVTGRRISGGGVVDLAIYGHQQATYGVYARSVCGATFDFYEEQVNTAGLYLGVVPSADGIVDEARDSQFNHIWLRGKNTASGGGSILQLDGDSGANASKNHVWNLLGIHLNSDAVDCINCDNIIFHKIDTYRFTGGTGRGLRVRGGATNAERARDCHFDRVSVVAADGTPSILFEGTDSVTQATTGHRIHLDEANGTPTPTVGPNATVSISTDNNGDTDAKDHYNLIVNGDMVLNQLAPATNADKSAGFDGGVVLTQTDTIALTQVSTPENGQAQCLRMTQSQAVAQRMGYMFVIPSADTIPLRGQGVALALRLRLSSSADVRVAILEWTGTADAVAGDIVADWTSTTYTTAGFFESTTKNVLSVLESACTANTWRNASGLTGYGGMTATVGSSANNLLVFVWTEGTVAQNVTLDIGQARLIRGYVPNRFVRETRDVMIARCERQVFKTYNLSVAPGTSTAVGAVTNNAHGAAQNSRFWVPFRERMRTTPASVTVYSTTGASGNIRDLSAGADKTASSASAGETAVSVFPTENLTDNTIIGFHVVATIYPWT